MTKDLAVIGDKAYFVVDGIVRRNMYMGSKTELNEEFREMMINCGYLTPKIKMTNVRMALDKFEGKSYEDLVKWFERRASKTTNTNEYRDMVKEWEKLKKRFGGKVVDALIEGDISDVMYVEMHLKLDSFANQVEYYKKNKQKLDEYAWELMKNKVKGRIGQYRRKCVQVLCTSEIEYTFVRTGVKKNEASVQERGI